jgi:formate hydrogenlyase subunit 6/NADH:ubiquinone oxidoreductase subunit I
MADEKDASNPGTSDPGKPAGPTPEAVGVATTAAPPAAKPAAAAKPKRKPKNLAVIDQRGCTGCEWCIPICPVDAIDLIPGDEHPLLNKLVEINYETCIGCVLCSEICPWDTIVRIPYDEALELAPKVTLRRYQDLKPEERIEGTKW